MYSYSCANLQQPLAVDVTNVVVVDVWQVFMISFVNKDMSINIISGLYHNKLQLV